MMLKSAKFLSSLIALVCLIPLVSACFGAANVEAEFPQDPEDARRDRHGKLTGDGIKLFGGDDNQVSKGASLGINSYLWRASLDTLSFAPLASVDPRGGVIITDWYESPDAKGERFKINVVILDTRLRADGLRVSVFRQEFDKNKQWRDAKVNDSVAREIEDKILTRARELRVADSQK